MPRSTKEECGGANIAAFLDTIAWSEIGARQLIETDDGYNVIVGSTHDKPNLFNDYSKHPNKLVTIRQGLKSTAAGRYQLLYRYYEPYRKLLKLPNFAPKSQDQIAIQMIKEQGAYNALLDGQFYTAAHRVANIWASFPGANYGQHEQKIELLASAFKRAGGKIKTL